MSRAAPPFPTATPQHHSRSWLVARLLAALDGFPEFAATVRASVQPDGADEPERLVRVTLGVMRRAHQAGCAPRAMRHVIEYFILSALADSPAVARQAATRCAGIVDAVYLHYGVQWTMLDSGCMVAALVAAPTSFDP